MVDPNETAAGAGASQAPGPLGTGALVGDGRYRLTRRLGRGGMAEVFAAEDVRLGRTVAVKLLRTDLAEDAVAKARFAREAQSVAGLNHHAVVAVYDSGEDVTPTGPVPYMVMELVEGHTIKDLLTGPTPPPPDQALLIVSGVLDALAYSHQHGIVHRDIKPANVIITTTGAVKVMDFGIARALHGAASTMTQTGMVMGTPQYLSPEQALGKTVDHRSDLYATGCLLYELLAMRPPFVGETPLSVVYQHVQDDPLPPSQANKRVPPELDGLVLHALAKQPEDRFQTAEEMRGVVAYAHQSLTQRGGWTNGAWDTGAVTAVAPRPATGPTMVAPVGGYAGGNSGSTAELGPPLLGGLSTGGPDDVHGYDERPPGGRGNRWVRPALFAVAAVLAVVLGVFLATRGSGGGGGHTPADTSPTTAVTQGGQSQPSDEPTDQQPETGEISTAPSESATSTATDSPTGTPSATATKPTTPPTTATKTPTTKPTKPTSTPTTAPPTTAPPTEPTTGGGTDGSTTGGPGGPVGGGDLSHR
jgi:serine/threonine-protein kinase